MWFSEVYSFEIGPPIPVGFVSSTLNVPNRPVRNFSKTEEMTLRPSVPFLLVGDGMTAGDCRGDENTATNRHSLSLADIAFRPYI
jgi:hypothetical protein